MEDIRRIALVEDNNDPEKLGRVKVRIYPEFESLDSNALPWAEPSVSCDICVKGTSDVGGFNIPERNAFILVDIDPLWQEFHYIGLTPNRERTDVRTNIINDLKGKVDLSASDPQPLFVQRTSDGVILYHCTDTGEIGIVSKNGLFAQYDKDGSFVLGKKDFSLLKITSEGVLTFKGSVNSNEGSLVLYDPLKEVLEKLLNHIHIAPNGPTQPAQDSSGSPLSALKDRIVKMETK